MLKSEELTCRDVTEKDVLELALLNTAIDIPSPTHPLTLIHGIVEHDNRILGAGFIKIIAEATIIINPAIPKRDKILVLRELYQEALRRLEGTGIDKVIALTDDELYAKALENKFYFEPEKGKYTLKLILE